MTACWKHDHLLAVKPAKDHFSMMTLDGRDGEMGDIFIMYLLFDLDLTGQVPQPAAKDNTHPGGSPHVNRTNKCYRFP